MAKRFTDTEKWKKNWFSELAPEMKLLWIYILDNCDSSGVWDVNFKLAEFQVGLPIDRVAVKEVFKKQYVEINGSKWFIKDFIEFQYKCSIFNLNPLNKAHIPVIAIVDKYNLKNVFKGLIRGLQDPMDMDKDKEKDKEKDKDIKTVNTKNKYADYVFMTEEEHKKLVEAYGEKATKKLIEILDNYKGSKGKTYKNDYRAILSWVVKKWEEDLHRQCQYQPIKQVSSGPRGIPTSIKEIIEARK